MKCEICHNAEAETAIVRLVNGKRQELYVCKACAARENKAPVREAVSAKSATGDGAAVEAKGGTSANVPPMLGMILGAAFDIIGHAIRDQQRPPVDPSCPTCGITRNEWRKAIRLGCPSCYETFARELDPIILEDQGALQHIGKAPLKYHVAAERVRLKAQLREAIDTQNFEKAIQLRNALDNLPVAPRENGGKTV